MTPRVSASTAKKSSANSKSDAAKSAWNQSLQLNYGTPELLFTKGKGAWLTDSAGERYLDFLAGIATNALGHAHPAITAAVNAQVRTLSHISNLYMHSGALALAAELQRLTGDKSARTFFCNSGTEANEAAFKIARLTGRKQIVSTVGGFHGRTAAALAMTGQPSKQKPFLPLVPHVRHVQYGDLKALRRVVSRRTAMVIIEPIQGENGVVVPPNNYLAGARALCDAFGVLLCIDAVQTGMGRTGEWFGYEHSGITPDIITLAKGLGGGLPLGAMITMGEKTPHFAPGDHGSTFGGNPISIAASLAVISEITSSKLMQSAQVAERRIKKALSNHPAVESVRGRGLLLGIVLIQPVAKDLAKICQKNGLLVNAPNDQVIRIAPPLIVSSAEISTFLKLFEVSLDEVLALHKGKGDS